MSHEPVAVDWPSAEVRERRLAVPLLHEPSREWVAELEGVLEQLAQPGHRWQTIKASRKRLKVEGVEPGAEADLHHLIESAVLEVNARSAADEDDDGAAGAEDRAMTDAFRAFAPSDAPPT